MQIVRKMASYSYGEADILRRAMSKKKESKIKSAKKTKKVKKPSYLKEVKNEMKNVSFPSAKQVIKYTLATILIVAFLVGFFLLLSAFMSWLKEAI